MSRPGGTLADTRGSGRRGNLTSNRQPAKDSATVDVGQFRHFERPLEMSAIPPIATKNGEPLKRRRANGNNFSNASRRSSPP